MALCLLAGKVFYVSFAGSCEFSAVRKRQQGKISMIRASQPNQI